MAKELNKSSKDIIYALKGHGVDVESHMSTISSDSADKIRKFFTQPAPKPVQKQENKPAQEARPAANRRPNQGGRIEGMDSRGNYSTPSRDSMAQDGSRTPRNQGSRNVGRDGSNQGNRSFNRDRVNQNGERSFNRDRNNQNGERSFNRDRNNQN
ncbi:MAG: translation initiation factor IF-2 N-terminal domain-containing protein, partial [Coprococcus sp.]